MRGRWWPTWAGGVHSVSSIAGDDGGGHWVAKSVVPLVRDPAELDSGVAVRTAGILSSLPGSELERQNQTKELVQLAKGQGSNALVAARQE